MSPTPDVPHLPPPVSPGSVLLPPDLSLAELGRAALPVSWLWHGYLAPGSVTLLTSD